MPDPQLGPAPGASSPGVGLAGVAGPAVDPAADGAGMVVRLHEFRSGSGWDPEPQQELDSPGTLLLLFGSRQAGMAPAALAAIDSLTQVFPESTILGCSTAGEILGAGVSDDTLALAVVRFAHSRIRLATAELAAADNSFAAGKALAASLDDEQLRAVFVLAPGLAINGSDLVRGLNTALGPHVVVTGGLAGDGFLFSQTWVLAGSGRAAADGSGPAPSSGHVAAVGLYGDRLVVGHGSRGGWNIFGPERMVTRSSGNVLYELDGKPALELYKAYLGDLAAGLPATGLRFPLALRESAGDARFLVRTILGIDEKSQSMHFAGDIPLGWRAQLMWANSDQLVAGAEAAASSVGFRESPVGSDTLAIAVSCVGRRMFLGADSDAELEATLAVLPAGTRQIGFYSYGELAPYDSGTCDLHNQTMTLTVISEA